jgi:flagellin-like hook-associated protein FlgL
MLPCNFPQLSQPDQVKKLAVLNVKGDKIVKKRSINRGGDTARTVYSYTVISRHKLLEMDHMFESVLLRLEKMQEYCQDGESLSDEEKVKLQKKNLEIQYEIEDLLRKSFTVYFSDMIAWDSDPVIVVRTGMRMDQIEWLRFPSIWHVMRSKLHMIDVTRPVTDWEPAIKEYRSAIHTSRITIETFIRRYRFVEQFAAVQQSPADGFQQADLFIKTPLVRGIECLEQTGNYLDIALNVIKRLKKISTGKTVDVTQLSNKISIEETDQLIDEISRIASHASFGGQSLLTGRFGGDKSEWTEPGITVISPDQPGTVVSVKIPATHSVALGFLDNNTREPLLPTDEDSRQQLVETCTVAEKQVLKTIEVIHDNIEILEQVVDLDDPFSTLVIKSWPAFTEMGGKQIESELDPADPLLYQALVLTRHAELALREVNDMVNHSRGAVLLSANGFTTRNRRESLQEEFHRQLNSIEEHLKLTVGNNRLFDGSMVLTDTVSEIPLLTLPILNLETLGLNDWGGGKLRIDTEDEANRTIGMLDSSNHTINKILYDLEAGKYAGIARYCYRSLLNQIDSGMTEENGSELYEKTTGILYLLYKSIEYKTVMAQNSSYNRMDRHSIQGYVDRLSNECRYLEQELANRLSSVNSNKTIRYTELFQSLSSGHGDGFTFPVVSRLEASTSYKKIRLINKKFESAGVTIPTSLPHHGFMFDSVEKNPVLKGVGLALDYILQLVNHPGSTITRRCRRKIQEIVQATTTNGKTLLNHGNMSPGKFKRSWIDHENPRFLPLVITRTTSREEIVHIVQANRVLLTCNLLHEKSSIQYLNSIKSAARLHKKNHLLYDMFFTDEEV